MKTSADLVVHPAPGHTLEGTLAHLQDVPLPGQGVDPQQHRDLR